ncbi:MAG TPA: GNAT family N-acetyltransferase [Acidimicrobiales bacterium]
MVEVRQFSRSDRDQLAHLANAHIGAVVPGWAVPTATLLSQLEREPGEYVVDPWVIARSTVVAIERDRLVAAAHLKRYADDDRVSDSFRDAGEIDWLVFWPDHVGAGRAVMDAAIRQLDAWAVRIRYADGSLPTTATYGVPEAWPHVRRLYVEAGFDAAGGQVEVQLAGSLSGVDGPGDAPIEGLVLQRAVGPLATSFNALLDGEAVGVFEVDDNHSGGGSKIRLAGWADECNHWVQEDLRGRGVGTWLLRHGAAWLRLGGTERLLVYLIENEQLDAGLRYYGRHGLRPINRTVRGWKASS